MKKVLITGGSGTIGTSFIKEFYDKYQFYSYSRNEKKQIALKRNFNKTHLYLGSVEDGHGLINTFLKIKPDIVIHAAALKHIDTGEKQPAQAVKINLLGSLNVIEASRIADVPITIGISSDKACLCNSVYGYTKNLMERMFMEADDEKNRFVCCRFGNVAGSHGSVIPYWVNLAKSNQSLPLTDPKMNRFMFSPVDAAYLIDKAIKITTEQAGGCILSKRVKSVNMWDLANYISTDVQVVGRRLGEKLNETLINIHELPYTYLDQDYIIIKLQKNNSKETRLSRELSSLNAEKMNKEEIKNLIEHVKIYLEKTLLSANEY